MKLPDFGCDVRTRIVFGEHRVHQLGELSRELGGERALLVSDPGVQAAGHVDAARQALSAAGIDCTVFTAVDENPTTAHVAACLDVARDCRPNLLIGLGGGSSLDAAKGCNFLYTNGGAMADYWGRHKAKLPMLPMIAVPTTAGTGSEMQSFALIANAETHQKMACGDTKATPAVALLDPHLTLTQPARVAALAGIDAVAHALESGVSTARTATSVLISREAFKLTIQALPVVLRTPHDLPARGRQLLGAACAGLAIENSMLGAAHAAANPLTARHGVTHGQAVGLMLPHVVACNAQEAQVGELYRQLAAGAGLPAQDAATATAAIVAALRQLLAQAELPTTLGDLGLTAADVPALAADAAGQWTAGFNPRPLDSAGFAALYLAAL